ncbi:MAG TPA: hypothetical protein VN151_03365, partial [Terracidiphilus sp.]|nr:hypothetical protein [Terracidiphilus sp.]
QARTVARRLAQITAKAAESTGALVLKASDLSAGHDVCSATPWATPIHPPADTPPTHFAPYHPNTQAMRAIATQLEALVPGP